MKVRNHLRLFWGWVFPYISRIHTAYIGEDTSILGTWNVWWKGSWEDEWLLFVLVRCVSSLDHQQYIHDFKILLRLKKEKDKLQQDYDRNLMGQKLEQQYPLLVQVAIQGKSLQIELFWDVYGTWLVFLPKLTSCSSFSTKAFFPTAIRFHVFFPRFLFKFLLNRICRIQWAPKNHNSSNDNDKNQK